MSGDLVFAASGETHEEIGKGAAYCGHGVAYVGGDTIILKPRNSVDPTFLGYAVNARDAERFKARYGQGSSVIHISAAHLGELPLVLPALPEQRRIAEILDTLDEAIRKTEQVIAKLQQMKQGLLHDLLTRGIDENGELRGPERHPKLFKDSPLGRIPRVWECVPTGTVSGSIVPGRDKPELDGGDFPWITVTDLVADEVVRSRLGLSLSLRSIQGAGSRIIPQGAVVMSCVGEFGVACVAGCSLVVNQQLHAFLPSSAILAEWLMHSIRRQGPKIDRMATQTTIKYLNKAGCESVLVPLPSIAEQTVLVDGLRTHAVQLSNEANALRKLRTLKHGLMDDLLTGKVRIFVPNEAAA